MRRRERGADVEMKSGHEPGTQDAETGHDGELAPAILTGTNAWRPSTRGDFEHFAFDAALVATSGGIGT
jgi:hypothetical protein